MRCATTRSPASGAVPCFRELDRKPVHLRAVWSRLEQLHSSTRTPSDLLAQVGTLDEPSMRYLQAGALAWARANTTVARARELLESLAITPATDESPDERGRWDRDAGDTEPPRTCIAVGEAGGRVIRGGSLRVAGTLGGRACGSDQRTTRGPSPGQRRLWPLPHRHRVIFVVTAMSEGGLANVAVRLFSVADAGERRSLVANLTGLRLGLGVARRDRRGRLRPRSRATNGR